MICRSLRVLNEPTPRVLLPRENFGVVFNTKLQVRPIYLEYFTK